MFNMISFGQRPGISKDQITTFKSLLLTILSSNIVTHYSYIKGDKLLFFYKSTCGKCSPETKLFTKVE